MKTKQLIFPAFFVMVLLQLFVPLRMIFQQENVLNTGQAFKFKTAPVDPYDPFRGKYIRLRFAANEFPVKNLSDWKYDDPVYVKLKTDENGFAKIAALSKSRPTDTESFVEASVSNMFSDPDENRLMVAYPFDRFYMEESKAYEAEVKYRDAATDENTIAYALVKVKNGIGVIENVFLNEKPIQDVVE